MHNITNIFLIQVLQFITYTKFWAIFRIACVIIKINENRSLVHRRTVYATRETQTKSLCYNFNQEWYKLSEL